MASTKAKTVDDAPSDELLLSHMDTDDPSLEVQSSLDGDEISATSSLTGLSAVAGRDKEAINAHTALVPRTIKIQLALAEENTPTSSMPHSRPRQQAPIPQQQTPFAQLCLNQRDGSIVPMLETSQQGGRASRRVELTPTVTPETFPSMTIMSATTATSSSLSYSTSCTLSTLTEGYSADDSSGSETASNSSPVVLGTTPIAEIDENGVALLNGETSPRRNIICSRAFKKLIPFRALKMRKVNGRCWGSDSNRPMMTRFSRDRGYEPL